MLRVVMPHDLLSSAKPGRFPWYATLGDPLRSSMRRNAAGPIRRKTPRTVSWRVTDVSALVHVLSDLRLHLGKPQRAR